MEKQKIAHLAFIIVIVIVLFLSCIPLASAYENTEYGFSVLRPSVWETQEDPNPNVLVKFVDPYFHEGAFIKVSYEAGVEGTLDNHPEPSGVNAYLSSKYDNFDLLFETLRYVDDLRGYEFIYTVNENGQVMKYQQEMFVVNDKTISVTCRSVIEEFDLLENTFDFCIESFRLLSTSVTTPTPTPTPNTNTVFPSEIIYSVTAVIITLIIAITIIIIKKK